MTSTGRLFQKIWGSIPGLPRLSVCVVSSQWLVVSVQWLVVNVRAYMGIVC